MAVPATLAPHLPPAHRRALAAAARVACLTAVVACGPKPPPAASAEAAVTGEAPAPAPAGDLSCADGIDPEATELSADDKACCERVVAHQETLEYPAAVEFALRGACCSALEWPGGLACTPWGPPVPPAMA